MAPVNAPPTITRIAPMLLSKRREPFDSDNWIFEPKWDGFRCVAIVRDGRARLHSGTEMI